MVLFRRRRSSARRLRRVAQAAAHHYVDSRPTAADGSGRARIGLRTNRCAPYSPVLKHGPNTACGGKGRKRPSVLLRPAATMYLRLGPNICPVFLEDSPICCRIRPDRGDYYKIPRKSPRIASTWKKGTGAEPERFPAGLASSHARSQPPFSTPRNRFCSSPVAISGTVARLVTVG